MDESPEELEAIRREAERIDPYKYRRRGRLFAVLGLGSLGAAVVWAVLAARDAARNPCQRVRDHYCGAWPGSPMCASYEGILRDSERDPSSAMRSNIREQCLRKIARLKEEDGVTLP